MMYQVHDSECWWTVITSECVLVCQVDLYFLTNTTLPLWKGDETTVVVFGGCEKLGLLLELNWIKKRGINTKHVRVGQVATPGGMHPKVRSSGQNYKAEASQSNSFTLNHWPFLSTSVLLRMSLLWKTKEQYSLKNDPVRVLIVKKCWAILLLITEKDQSQLMGNKMVQKMVQKKKWAKKLRKKI